MFKSELFSVKLLSRYIFKCNLAIGVAFEVVGESYHKMKLNL